MRTTSLNGHVSPEAQKHFLDCFLDNALSVLKAKFNSHGKSKNNQLDVFLLSLKVVQNVSSFYLLMIQDTKQKEILFKTTREKVYTACLKIN